MRDRRKGGGERERETEKEVCVCVRVCVWGWGGGVGGSRVEGCSNVDMLVKVVNKAGVMRW